VACVIVVFDGKYMKIHFEDYDLWCNEAEGGMGSKVDNLVYY